MNSLFYGGGGQLLTNQVVAIIAVVAFSFCVSWVIAMAIHKTIGLRAPVETEDDLDVVQQEMSAYAFDRVGAASPLAPFAAQLTLVGAGPAARLDGREKLVTAFVDHGQTGELRQVLATAGATSIILSEVSVYPGVTRTEVVRGQRWSAVSGAWLRITWPPVLFESSRSADAGGIEAPDS